MVFIVFLFLGIIMLCMCIFFGFLPLFVKSRNNKYSLFYIFGGGILIGIALLISIPEGIGKYYESQYNLIKKNQNKGTNNTDSVFFDSFEVLENYQTGMLEIHQQVGFFLILGFTIMHLFDQIITYASRKKSNDEYLIPLIRQISLETSQTDIVKYEINASCIITYIGILIHCITDGIAFGSAAFYSDNRFGLLIFLSIAIHEAPVMFGLSTFLLHEDYDESVTKKAILFISLVNPISSIITFSIISLFSSTKTLIEESAIVPIFLLISGGTFLYISTMYVLPEIYCKISNHSHSHDYESKKSKKKDKAKKNNHSSKN